MTEMLTKKWWEKSRSLSKVISKLRRWITMLKKFLKFWTTSLKMTSPSLTWTNLTTPSLTSSQNSQMSSKKIEYYFNRLPVQFTPRNTTFSQNPSSVTPSPYQSTLTTTKHIPTLKVESTLTIECYTTSIPQKSTTVIKNYLYRLNKIYKIAWLACPVVNK